MSWHGIGVSNAHANFWQEARTPVCDGSRAGERRLPACLPA